MSGPATRTCAHCGEKVSLTGHPTASEPRQNPEKHKHQCADSTDAAHGLGGVAVCLGRGYHQCACGARQYNCNEGWHEGTPTRIYDGGNFAASPLKENE